MNAPIFLHHDALSSPLENPRLRGPARLATKDCKGCDRHLPREAFYIRKNGQVVSRCKECSRRDARQRSAEEKRLSKQRHRVRHGERLRAYSRAYHSTHRAQRAAAVRARKSRDPAFKLTEALRRSLATAVRNARALKGGRTLELLGCQVPEFMAMIERQWAPGMSWGNWGRGAGRWHLDHKRPVSSFDLTDPAQQRACFHFSNFQPLWSEDNLRKGAKWGGV